MKIKYFIKNAKGFGLVQVLVIGSLLAIVVYALTSRTLQITKTQSFNVQKNISLKTEQMLKSIFSNPASCTCQFSGFSTTAATSVTKITNNCSAPTTQAGYTVVQAGTAIAVDPAATPPVASNLQVESMQYEQPGAGTPASGGTQYATSLTVVFKQQVLKNGMTMPVKKMSIPLTVLVNASNNVTNCGINNAVAISTPSPAPGGTYVSNNKMAQSALVSGIGSPYFLPYWVGFSQLMNSIIFQDPSGGGIGVGTVPPAGMAITCDATPLSMVDVCGTVNAVAVTYTSDRRLKQDIRPLEDMLAKMNALQPVTYHWNALASQIRPVGGKNLQTGLLAQDVEKVFPEAVKNQKDGYKSVNYANLIAPLVATIQELHAQNNDLAASNKALAARITQAEQWLSAKKASAAAKTSDASAPNANQ